MKNTLLIEKQILQFEEKLIHPSTRRSSKELAQLIADNFIEFGSSGKVYTKQQVIEALDKEMPDKITIENFTCTELSMEIALVTYHSTRHKQDGDKIFCLRSSVWKLFDDGWKIIFHQGTLCE